ncbi:type II toxin-antitoxin system VapC family toxin [Sorangium sp. So ce1151]|uniref:type II toxin-antitoxin system VapC family toxin n=1 Tax=Sorangium sp. So ce1151 TaxID=3133332 RepID=UPI003F6016A2
MKIYLDSCIVIYWVEMPDPFYEPVAHAMRSMGSALYCISDLVRLEARVGPLRRAQADVLAMFEQAFSAMKVLPLSAAVFDHAAELRARHGLKTPDALHAAAAIVNGCDELWTNDRRFAAIEGHISVRVVTS